MAKRQVVGGNDGGNKHNRYSFSHFILNNDAMVSQHLQQPKNTNRSQIPDISIKQPPVCKTKADLARIPCDIQLFLQPPLPRAA